MICRALTLWFHWWIFSTALPVSLDLQAPVGWWVVMPLNQLVIPQSTVTTGSLQHWDTGTIALMSNKHGPYWQEYVSVANGTRPGTIKEAQPTTQRTYPFTMSTNSLLSLCCLLFCSILFYQFYLFHSIFFFFFFSPSLPSTLSIVVTCRNPLWPMAPAGEPPMSLAPPGGSWCRNGSRWRPSP